VPAGPDGLRPGSGPGRHPAGTVLPAPATGPDAAPPGRRDAESAPTAVLMVRTARFELNPMRSGQSCQYAYPPNPQPALPVGDGSVD
jgi:hypothetical protein